MSTPKLLGILVILVIALGFIFAMPGFRTAEPASDSVSSPVQDQDVKRLVEDFGARLKEVSLLAPKEQLRAAMATAYGPYVSSELIALWVDDPDSALGRQTSSPWPDRIQVGTMEERDGGFVVQTTVIEVANSDEGEQIVGTYPVELQVDRVNGVWMITGTEKGSYSQIPARGTIVGTYTCLPHRDTSGPQTMECAFGVQEESSGEYYAINTMLMSSTEWMNIPTGSRISVEGVLVPVDTISSNQWQKYDIIGVISATTIQRI